MSSLFGFAFYEGVKFAFADSGYFRKPSDIKIYDSQKFAMF